MRGRSGRRASTKTKTVRTRIETRRRGRGRKTRDSSSSGSNYFHSSSTTARVDKPTNPKKCSVWSTGGQTEESQRDTKENKQPESTEVKTLRVIYFSFTLECTKQKTWTNEYTEVANVENKLHEEEENEEEENKCKK